MAHWALCRVSRYATQAHRRHNIGRLCSGVLFVVMLLALPLVACVPSSASDEIAGVITFGVTVPITGPDVLEGRYALDGYLLFVNTINQHGGLAVGGKQYRVALDYYDDQSNPSLTAQLYTRLITHDNVNFLLGPYSSLLTAAAVPIAERYGVPMVDGHGSADSAYSSGKKYVFSVISPAKNYLADVLALVRQHDPTAATVALLGADEPFSQEAAAGAAEYAQAHGMTVMYQQHYPPNTADMSAEIAAIKQLNPDVVLVSGHLQDDILFMRQAHAVCLSPKAVGMTVGPALAEFRANLGAQGNYVLGATQWTAALNYRGTDMWGTPKAYAEAFLQAYPNYSEVPYQAADSTAALLAYQQALQSAGALDPVAVASALARVDIMTFYGRIKFDSRGVNVYKPMAVTQLQPDGKDYTVAPANVAQRIALYPMPPCMGG